MFFPKKKDHTSSENYEYIIFRKFIIYMLKWLGGPEVYCELFSHIFLIEHHQIIMLKMNKMKSTIDMEWTYQMLPPFVIIL